jgi:uncharacterized membrane protein YjjP (DUF1212 family)
MRKNEYIQKTKFVSDIGLSLHQCGATSHRIERHLVNLCELLGIHGTFLHTPTSFTFCFWQDNPMNQQIQIERVQPSDGNLGQLELIDTLVARFEAHELGFDDMRLELDQILATPKYYSRWVNCIAWIVLSASFAALLSDNAADALVSGLVAIPIFFLALITEKSERMSNTVEILASLISGVLVAGIAVAGVKINVPFVILSTVIVFIPGLSLTVALSEIAERDLVSGTSKFVHSVMGLFKLYFGAILGVGIGKLLWGMGAGDTIYEIQHLPEWKTFPLISLISLALTIAFNIRIQQAPWCLLAALTGYYVSQSCGASFGIAAGMFLGAFAVGIYSNLFAMFKNNPASVVLTQGLILLVPGSKTYIILNSWITGKQMLTTSANSNQAFLIFISLVAGLLFSNAVLPTRKSL